jgi:hypothetical protein
MFDNYRKYVPAVVLVIGALAATWIMRRQLASIEAEALTTARNEIITGAAEVAAAADATLAAATDPPAGDVS